MRTKTTIAIAVLLLAASAIPALAGLEPGKKSQFHTTFRVEVQGTAAEQYGYALGLRGRIAATPPGEERLTLVLQSAVAFQEIPKRWPSDRALAARAWLAAADVLYNGQIYMKAIEVCSLGELEVGRGNAARLAALRGSSLVRLGRYGDAASAFEAATRPERLADLEDMHKLDVLNRAAELHERTGNDREAARLLRMAARYSQTDVHRLGVLLRSIAASERCHDADGARADLAALDEALSRSREARLTAGEAEALKVFEAQVDRHRQKGK